MRPPISHCLFLVAATCVCSILALHGYSADFPGDVSEWNGFPCHRFELDGCKCTLVRPTQPAEGLPWLLHANSLDANPEIITRLLNKGFHIAYMEVETLYGNDTAIEHWNTFYGWAKEALQLAEKPVLAAKAHGSLLVYHWAARHVDSVSCIYVEQPWLQVDPATEPDDAAKEIIMAALKANGKEGATHALAPQADLVGKAMIPIIHVYGERRPGVVPDKSIEQFYAAYRMAGKGPFQSITRTTGSDEDKMDRAIAPLLFILKHTGQVSGAPVDTPIAGMERWKVAEFAGGADVFVLDDVLVIEEGNEMTGVVCAEEPIRMNYEITLDAMRLAGGDFFCGLTAPFEDTHFSLVVGGWGGTCVGISSLNWLDAYHNETAVFRSFEDHRWYRIRLRVTPGNIKAWIDGKETVNVDVDKEDVDIRWEMSPTVPLGIATWCTTGAIRNFSARTLE